MEITDFFNLSNLINLSFAGIVSGAVSYTYSKKWQDKRDYLNNLKEYLSEVSFLAKELNLTERGGVSIINYSYEETYGKIETTINKIASIYCKEMHKENKNINKIAYHFLENVRAGMDEERDRHRENQYEGNVDGHMEDRERGISCDFIISIKNAANEALDQLNYSTINNLRKVYSMNGNENNQYLIGMFYFLLFTCIGIAAPFLAVNDFLSWKPNDEDMAEWVQRAGAIVIICAVYIEFNKYSMSIKMKQLGVNSEKYQKTYTAMTVLFASLSIAGTIIWGYGDVWINYLLEYFGVSLK